MSKRIFRKSSLLLIVCVLSILSGVYFGHAAKANAAIKCYTIGTSNVQVYSNTGLTKKYGTIYPSDEIIVKKVTDRYCKVTYPISRGTKTGYISTGKILTKTMGNSYTSRAKITTYRRANNSITYGYISKGDSVKVLGASGSYTQVKYPVSGGYKYAFIKTTALNSNILPVNSNSAGSLNGTYKLVSAVNGNYVMDVNGASLFDGANIQLYQDNGSNAQKFTFTKQSDGYYTIKNVNSGKMVDCFGAGKSNGTNICQYESNNTAAQRWKVISVGNGYYTLTCKCNGLLIDLSGGISANGTNIQVYSANNSAAQKWKLVKSDISNTTNSASQTLGSPVPSGCKFNMKSNDGGWYGFHDINRGVSTSTPVYAITEGTITYKQAYTNYGGGVKKLTSYGNFIEFKSSNGVYTAKYCHLNSFVGATQKISSSMTKRASGSSGTYNLGSRNVRKGEIIGYIGKTGNASGVHLHFELRKNGVRIDPTSVIAGLY